MKFECRKLKEKLERGRKDQSKGKAAEIEKSSTAAIACDGDVIIVCGDGFINFTNQDSTYWVVNLAASFHITS